MIKFVGIGKHDKRMIFDIVKNKKKILSNNIYRKRKTFWRIGSSFICLIFFDAC